MTSSVPSACRETPISEATIVATAVGAAVVGMRPVAEIMFMDFVFLALDQIANQAAKMHFMFGGRATVPMVVRMPSGSGSGAASQHSQSLESILMHFPGLIVIAPSTPYDAKGLLLSAIRNPNPVCFVEHKALYKTKGEVPEEDYTVPIGVAEIKRPGRDITVVANNVMVMKTLNVAARLAQGRHRGGGGRSRAPCCRSTPQTILDSVRRTGRLLVVHEACQTGGWAGEVIASVVGSPVFDYVDAPVRRLGGKDIPIPYNRGLERIAIPQEDDIEREIRALVGGTV